MIDESVRTYFVERGFGYNPAVDFERESLDRKTQKKKTQGIVSNQQGMWFATVGGGYLAASRSPIALYAFVEMHDWDLPAHSHWMSAPVIGEGHDR